MNLLKTIAVAFSMFTAIPMPQFQWEKENTRYMLIALPLVGVVCGVCVGAWSILVGYMGYNTFLYGVGVCMIPIIITGGIHLDGYCDTADAISSHGDREKKLEILSDPHIGAFGVLALLCYILIYIAIATQIVITAQTIVAMGLMFILSRSITARAVATIPCTKNTGLAHMFASMAEKKQVKTVLTACIIAIFTILIALSWRQGILMVIASGITYLLWQRKAIKHFGGITGDVVGSLLQRLEIAMLLAIMIGG